MVAAVRGDARKGDVRSGRGPLRALRAHFLATSCEALAVTAPALARPLARSLVEYCADAAVPLPRATAKRICRSCTRFMIRRGGDGQEDRQFEGTPERSAASTSASALGPAWAEVREGVSPGKRYARVARRALGESEAAEAARKDRRRRRGERRASLGPTAKVTVWTCGQCGHSNAYPETEGPVGAGAGVGEAEDGHMLGTPGAAGRSESPAAGAGLSSSARKRKRKEQWGALKAQASAQGAPRTPSPPTPAAGHAWLSFGTPPSAGAGRVTVPGGVGGARSKPKKRHR